MATWIKYNCLNQDLGRKVHNLNSDTLKIVLTNSAPDVAAHTVLSDVTQIANGNGYTTDGATVANTAFAQSSGTGKLVGDDLTFTSVTGNMGPFRYGVLYNSTASGKNLIAYCDRGASITLDGTSGDTVKFDIDGANGVFQLTY